MRSDLLAISAIAVVAVASAASSWRAHAQDAPPGGQRGGFDGGFGGGFDGGFRGRGGGGRGGGPPIALDPAQLQALKALYQRPQTTPFPPANPPTVAKVALGRRLFFEPKLSASGRLACASCHDVRRGFTDGEALSLGVKGERLSRHTPTVINLAWSKAFFWDGRADTLEQQSVMPIADEKEMGMAHPTLVQGLDQDAEYRRLFRAAFPTEGITISTVGKALAAFQRTLVFADAPFDRWIAGDETAISDEAKRGFVDFNTRAGCAQCHSGWNFSDGRFHDIGLPTQDLGRFGVEPDESLRHAFKTPGLRNIAQRGPYMHAGQLRTLRDVLRFYDNGSDRRPSLAAEMRGVRVRGGREIISFLETLTTPVPDELVRLQERLDAATGRNMPSVVAAAN